MNARNSEPNTATRVRMRAPERRAKIIAAAREAFIQHGLSGARTRDIADRAGITEAFMFRVIASKEEMYRLAILEPVLEGFRELSVEVKRLDGEYSDPVEFIREVQRVSLVFFDKTALLFGIAMFSELAKGRVFYNDELGPLVEESANLIAERAGWARRGLDASVIRRVFFGTLWVIGLDAALRSKPIDTVEVSAKLSLLFASSAR